MVKLGINVDHIATLRQARREFEPDPLTAARVCEKAGADSIVAHLREDRRHIQDRDIKKLRQAVRTRFNMEMSVHPGIVRVALNIKPDQATLVPEKRQEITTEGGLDIVSQFSKIKSTVEVLQKHHIPVSLFIDPSPQQILKAKETGARYIELHTGTYARAGSKAEMKKELIKLKSAAHLAHHLGLVINAGHGLNYTNTAAVARIPFIHELNIGHSIISRAVFVGLDKAVKEMVHLIRQ